MDRFRTAFEASIERLCAARAQGACVLGRTFAALPPAEQASRLEVAITASRTDVPAWLEAIGAYPGLPPRHRAEVARHLVSEATGVDAPFSTVVAIEVFHNLPDLLPPGFLHSLIDRPPLGADLVRLQAFDLLGEVARAEDLDLLERHLWSEDLRLAQRALVALGRVASDRARETLRSHLTSLTELPPAFSEDLANALTASGLVNEVSLVERLLDSPDEAIVLGALNAVGRARVELDRDLARRIADLASDSSGHPEASVRSKSIEVLGLGGRAAAEVLRDRLSEAGWPVRERLLGIQALFNTGNPEAAAAALALIDEIDRAPDLQLAATIAAAAPSAREELERRARSWLRRHASQGVLLRKLLTTSNKEAVVRLAQALFDFTG